MASKTKRRVIVSVRLADPHFGCVGVVRDAKTNRLLAETAVVSYGFDGSAREAAFVIVNRRGWVAL